jgi:hypothetical protein
MQIKRLENGRFSSSFFSSNKKFCFW